MGSLPPPPPPRSYPLPDDVLPPSPPPVGRTGGSSFSASPTRQRPSIVLGEAYGQLLPFWRRKCYALLWASLSLDLVTQWWKRCFTRAYKELANLRWRPQLAAGAATSSS